MLMLILILILFINIILFIKFYCKNRIIKIFYNKYEIKDIKIPSIIDKKYIVSFTTIPSRIKYVPKVINNLKNQIIKPYKIFVCIPYFSKRKNIEYKIPNDWSFNDDVVIIRCKDFGPATKLLGCLDHVYDNDMPIITIDDDIIYESNTFKKLIAYSMVYPDSAISYSYLANDELMEDIYNKKDTSNYSSPLVGYLEGYSSVLYKKKYIIKDMLDFYNNDTDINNFLSDDLTISTWLNMQNIKLIGLNPKNIITVNNTVHKIDALSLEINEKSRNIVYTNCLNNMRKLKNVRKYISTKSYFYMSDIQQEDHDILLIRNNMLPPNIKFNSEKYKNIKNNDIICIKTYYLKDFINKIFRHLKVKIILITTDADETIPGDVWIHTKKPKISFKNFLKDSRLIHWFSTNLQSNIKDNKISGIPLGLDYHTEFHNKFISNYIQDNILRDIKNSIPILENRSLKVFYNGHLNNTSSRFKLLLGEDRIDIYNTLKNNKNIDCQKDKMPRYDLWKLHGNYSFIVSPVENGLDCHRTWEALVLGCIVIVKKTHLDESIYKNLSVIIIQEWSEITTENLLKWKTKILNNKLNLKKLETNYWKKEFNKYKTI